jgi:hypothetical protein
MVFVSFFTKLICALRCHFFEHFIFDGCKNESRMVVRVIMKYVIKLLINVLDFF